MNDENQSGHADFHFFHFRGYFIQFISAYSKAKRLVAFGVKPWNIAEHLIKYSASEASINGEKLFNEISCYINILMFSLFDMVEES